MILQQLTHGAVARRKARAAVVIHIVNRRGALQKEMTIIPSPCGYDDRAIGNDGAIRVCVGSPCSTWDIVANVSVKTLAIKNRFIMSIAFLFDRHPERRPCWGVVTLPMRESVWYCQLKSSPSCRFGVPPFRRQWLRSDRMG